MITHSPAETRALGAALARQLLPGDVLVLEGDLGAGKTLFVQSLARTLGVEGEVTSPTFNLMNVYEGIRGTSTLFIRSDHLRSTRCNGR